MSARAKNFWWWFGVFVMFYAGLIVFGIGAALKRLCRKT